MPGIDFQKRFAEAVKAGKKTQTIRKRRNPPIETGQHLTLWTGMRTKQCDPLGDATCTNVEPIKIIPERKEIWCWDTESEFWSNGEITGNFYLLSPVVADVFAKADGFDNLQDFFDFFKNYPEDVLHFELVVISWRLGWDFKKGAKS